MDAADYPLPPLDAPFLSEVAADYILRHSARESSDLRSDGRLLSDGRGQGGRQIQMITGAIVMLIGILVGFALARSNSDTL